MKNYLIYLLSKLPGIERSKTIVLSKSSANSLANELRKVSNGDELFIYDQEGLKVIFKIKETK